MSLINDALKRAKQSQQQQRQSPYGGPPPPLVEVKAPAGPGWAFPVLIVLLMATVFIFIGLAFFKSRQPAMQTIPAPAAKHTQTAAVPALPKAPATSQTVAVVTPKPAAPSLKLQGIFYNASKPEAIVNGMDVFVGDTVSGSRVELITRTNVWFTAPDGSRKQLTLGE